LEVLILSTVERPIANNNQLFTAVSDFPRWVVAVDQTAPMEPQVLAQMSEDRTSGRFPLAIYEGAEMTDGQLTVRFKPVSGRVDQAAGLVWRHGDENNYKFTVSFDGKPLFDVVDATFTQAGKVGLWTKADSVTYFDGFEILER
jgi:hypothetical protein